MVKTWWWWWREYENWAPTQKKIKSQKAPLLVPSLVGTTAVSKKHTQKEKKHEKQVRWFSLNLALVPLLVESGNISINNSHLMKGHGKGPPVFLKSVAKPWNSVLRDWPVTSHSPVFPFTTTMASLVAIRRSQNALLRPFLLGTAVRPMTILSKESAEEYKKLVSLGSPPLSKDVGGCRCT